MFLRYLLARVPGKQVDFGALAVKNHQKITFLEANFYFIYYQLVISILGAQYHPEFFGLSHLTLLFGAFL